MRTQMEKAELFRALHERPGAFIIPNPWDAGTAKLLASLGFEALATTSSGFAFSAATHIDVRTSYAASSLLAKQIEAERLAPAADILRVARDAVSGSSRWACSSCGAPAICSPRRIRISAPGCIMS